MCYGIDVGIFRILPSSFHVLLMVSLWVVWVAMFQMARDSLLLGREYQTLLICLIEVVSQDFTRWFVYCLIEWWTWMFLTQ